MNKKNSAGAVMLGVAAGAAVGAVGAMAANKNSREMKKNAKKVGQGAEHAVTDLEKMLGRYLG